MNNHSLSILIGGVAAAVLLGISGVFQKSAQGISQGPYLVVVGLVITLVGGLWWLVTRASDWSVPAIGSAALFALLAPLYNMNTLVAVLIGLTIMGESKNVQPVPICIGAALIVVGGIIATRG